MSAPLDILISGVGIAGPVVAYWLLKANPFHRITVLERDTQLRTAGQSIDIREFAVDVIRRMGVEAAIKDKVTHEAGLNFVNDKGGVIATFAASGDADNQSFTSEYEIFRGDLVQILYDTVKDRVETVFGDYVVDYNETGEKIEVVTKNGKLSGSWDVVVACDGQSSKIRNIALGTTDNPREHWLSFYNYTAYFTAKEDLLDGTKMAKWYNTTLGRVLFVRPDTRPNMCRANIIRQLNTGDTERNKRYRDALAAGSAEFKRILREDFTGAGWKMDQLLDDMDASDDFYASETAQIRPPTLIKGRVAFLGDAGFCPTPITGMGTSLAVIGAYVLAGEIANSNEDVRKGLEGYNSVMFPYARKVQSIPSTTPQYVNPQTWWGVSLQRGIVKAAGWINSSGVIGILGKLPGASLFQGKTWTPPTYPWDTHGRRDPGM